MLKTTQQRPAAVLCRCLFGCAEWGAHRRHLANTIKPSLCGDDEALCQIAVNLC